MSGFRTSRIFDVVLVVILVAAVLIARQYRTELGDWWYFRSYEPSAEVVKVAQAAGFNEAGTKLFYRADPQFVDKSTIDQACDIENLACLDSRGQIFILDEPGQFDQTVVSAAHEMLHLAYRRLSQADKETLAPLLDQSYSNPLYADLSQEVASQESLDNKRDEAHSLLGSEHGSLDVGLEDHYAKYYSNRQLVVAANKRSQ